VIEYDFKPMCDIYFVLYIAGEALKREKNTNRSETIRRVKEMNTLGRKNPSIVGTMQPSNVKLR
jgi:hypothetical protein